MITITIVGAGFAGLSAAYELTRRGHCVQLFEARTRVGGRVFSKIFQGSVLEQGALFIDSSHSAVRAYAQHFGLVELDRWQTQPNYQRLPGQYLLHGRAFNSEQLADHLQPVLTAIARVRGSLSFEALDALSCQQFIDQLDTITPALKQDFSVLSQAILASEYGLDLDQMNALHLFEIPGAEHDPSLWLTRSTLDHRFHIRGGNAQLAQALAQALPEKTLHLEHSLQSVTQTAEHHYQLSFQTPQGQAQHETQALVLALPLHLYQLCSTCSYDSIIRDAHHDADVQPLKIPIRLLNCPSSWQQACSQLPMGNNLKLFLHFDRNIWLKPEEQQQLFSLVYPNTVAWNGAPEDASATSSWVTLFLGGAAAAKPLTDAAQRQLAETFIQTAASALPLLKDASLLAITPGTHWPSEPFTQGSYGGVKAPGQWQLYERWTTQYAQDGLAFAGTEWHLGHVGYMNGALLSGQRAATHLHAWLNQSR